MRQWQWIMRLLFGRRKMPVEYRLKWIISKDRRLW